MFEFKNILPSKVLEYGTDMSCLDDKFYVCRVKKNFGINNSENTIVLEAGDIIVCHNDYVKDGDSKRYNGIAVSTKSAVMDMTSKNSMDHWTSSCLGLIPMMSINDFKNSFEVLDDETESLADCICFAQTQKQDEELKAANKKCDNITLRLYLKEERRNYAINIGAIIVCVLGIICLEILCHKYYNCPFQDLSFTGIIGIFGITIGLAFFTWTGLFLFFRVYYEDPFFTPFDGTTQPLQDAAVKEKSNVLNSIYSKIDEYRRERGWLS